MLVNTGTSAAQDDAQFLQRCDRRSLVLAAVVSTVRRRQQHGGFLGSKNAGGRSDTGDRQAAGRPQLLTGSAQLTTNGHVSGFVIFRHNDQEAVVPLESRNASAYIIAFDNTGGTATGIAVNAVSTGPVNIPVTVRDDTGAQIATDTLNLARNGHLAFTLATQKYPATANIRGTIEFDTPAGAQIGALGIRMPTGAAHAYTTLPALAK